MKRLLIGLIITSNIIFAGIQNDIDSYKEFDEIPRVELAKLLTSEMAKSMQLPMKLDEATTLTTIYSFKTNIIFRKVINTEYPQIKNFWNQNKKQFIEAMLKQDSQNICYNPVWKYMIFNRNIIPEFNYLDTSNKPLFSYTIEKVDCDKLN